MLIEIFEKINHFNEIIFAPLDKFIENLPMADWAADAVIDSFHMLPLLFLAFVLIEIMEFYFSDKIDRWVKTAKKSSVAVGALASILPQCGFSVIASSLYSRKLLTRGCLIAVYLGTSDESIPILLAYPEKAHLIIPIVGIKLFIAILAGYFIDFVGVNIEEEDETPEEIEVHEEGCCNHNPETGNKKELILHPILHTANIFAFIIVITLFLNFVLENVSINSLLHTSHKYLQCVIAAIVGLIPNCAVSIAVTMMLIKGSITFPAAMSGLLSNAGLGLLVLLRHNDFKDTVKIIFTLLLISIGAGWSIQFLL
ncbi:MAG: arsenic efflux protein [Candidatus Gastranaerophilales bacterium]|nr:arsenic efflux protein [Candidatus Gastranaerophilales bacterium]MCM1073518.1 arsenic efflux protein [Bacteroides sp.]